MAFDISPIILSVKVAVLATVICAATGTGLAWAMHRFKLPGKNILETVINLPLVLPPTVIGFGLLLLFGRNGPLGFVLEKLFNVRIVFTWWAAVIASTVVSFPMMYRSAKAGLASVSPDLEQAARTLGAGEWRVFLTVTLPLAWPGILTGIGLAFSRALGEFGATLMLAGNIPGRTQTIPLAIFFAAESGDMKAAGFFVFIITLVSFAVVYCLNSWPVSKKAVSKPQGGDGYVGTGCQKSLT